jgi:undecaprenyl-diphosphatase
MMWESIFVGAIQGITEFLPVSSSAHLILVPWILGDKGTLIDSLSFDVGLHFGTLLAVALFFSRDWIEMAAGFLPGGSGKATGPTPASSRVRLALCLVAGTLPAAIAGYYLEKTVEEQFRNPAIIAAALIAGGAIMLAAERLSKQNRQIDEIGYLDALLIGAAQAVALVPGISRSGITIAAGLILGISRRDSAKFSFLLSTPVIAGAALLKSKALLAGLGGQEGMVILLGMAAAAISGYLSIGFLLKFLNAHKLDGFVYYRWLLGIAILAGYFGIL